MFKKIMLALLSFLMLFGVFAGVGSMMVSAKETPSNISSTYTKKDKANKIFYEVSMKKILKKFKNKESFYVFFGFENCPWCKEAKPILKKEAKRQNLKIYYVKTRDENGERLYSEKQRKQLLKYIPTFMKTNADENNKKWLYVPLLVQVAYGKTIDGHQGTIKGHNAKERKMTTKEKQKLYCIYKRVLSYPKRCPKKKDEDDGFEYWKYQIYYNQSRQLYMTSRRI